MATTYSNEMLSLGQPTDFDLAAQLNTGSVSISDDSSSFLFETSGAASGVSKSTLNIGFDAVSETGTITAEMEFYIPAGTTTERIYIADFESINANTGKAPGTRVFIENGRIGIDRGKVGYEDIWYATHAPIDQEQWYSLRVELVPAAGSDGHIRVILDGQTVFEGSGSMILTQSIVDQYGFTLVGGEIDRVQLGLTANDSNEDAAIATRNMSVTVEDPANSVSSSFTLDPATAVAGAERAVDVFSAPYTQEDGPQIDDQQTPAPPAEEPTAEEPPAPTPTDPLAGTAGNDTIIGETGDDTLDAGDGDDIISGGQGDDVMIGGAGDDIIIDGSGSDTMYGGDGNDAFIFIEDGTVQGATNVIDGGSGYDSLVIVLSRATTKDFIQSGIRSRDAVLSELGLEVTDIEDIEVRVELNSLNSDLAGTGLDNIPELWA